MTMFYPPMTPDASAQRTFVYELDVKPQIMKHLIIAICIFWIVPFAISDTHNYLKRNIGTEATHSLCSQTVNTNSADSETMAATEDTAVTVERVSSDEYMFITGNPIIVSMKSTSH